MVFDTFSDTQTLCRPDRNRNTTCCFSDAESLDAELKFFPLSSKLSRLLLVDCLNRIIRSQIFIIFII